MVEMWSKEPPRPRTLSVTFAGLTRADADRLIQQGGAMGFARTSVAAEDGLPLPDTIAVIVRRAQFEGTTKLVHVVGEGGAVEVAARLASEPGGPVLACHAPCSWEEYRTVCAAVGHRRDAAGWVRLGPPPGAANIVESALASAKGRPAGLVRLPVAERVVIPEVAR